MTNRERIIYNSLMDASGIILEKLQQMNKDYQESCWVACKDVLTGFRYTRAFRKLVHAYLNLLAQRKDLLERRKQ